jgi:hypothetical protein
MLKRIERETRSDASFDTSIGSPVDLRKAPDEQSPDISNVIPFRGTRTVARSLGPVRDKNLGELEAENAQLRISAIQLVLEIQNLRERRCR